MDEFDVCIIGGGTVGSYLAASLLKKRIGRVAVIQGDKRAAKMCFLSKSSTNYAGLEAGRLFGESGTSQIWGGQMIGFSDTELGVLYDRGDPLKDIYKTLASTYRNEVFEVLNFNLFSKDKAGSNLNHLESAGEFNLRYSSWLGFKNRNIKNVLDKHKLYSDQVNSLTKFKGYVLDFNKGTFRCGKLQSIFYMNARGDESQIHAKKFIICSGAMETTRLVKCLQYKMNGKSSYPIHKFSDHISVKIGEIKRANKKSDFSRYFGQIVLGKKMFTPRLEIFPSSTLAAMGFIHFAFKRNKKGVLELIQKLLLKRQGKLTHKKITLIDLVSDFNYLLKLTLSLLLRNRVYYDPSFDIEVFLVLETDPINNNSKIEFNSKDKTLKLDWQISSSDIENINTITERFKVWFVNNFGIDKFSYKQEIFRHKNLYDIYHPYNTLVVSNTEHADINSELQVNPFENVYALCTGIMENIGSINPGFVQFLLAEKLANTLSEIRE